MKNHRFSSIFLVSCFVFPVVILPTSPLFAYENETEGPKHTIETQIALTGSELLYDGRADPYAGGRLQTMYYFTFARQPLVDWYMGMGIRAGFLHNFLHTFGAYFHVPIEGVLALGIQVNDFISIEPFFSHGTLLEFISGWDPIFSYQFSGGVAVKQRLVKHLSFVYTVWASHLNTQSQSAALLSFSVGTSIPLSW